MFADLVEGLVEGLLAGLGRVNGWTLSVRAGHATPDRVQKFLNAASWSADVLRDYVIAGIGDPEVTLVLDDTQVQKKGTHSVRVAHQHCGLTGDVRFCTATDS